MLILLPNRLHEEMNVNLFCPLLAQTVSNLDGLIAETPKEGRRFLKQFLPEEVKIQDFRIEELTHRSTKQEIERLLEPVLLGQTWGVITDAGLPCLADPGSHLVKLAKKKNIKIESLPGPSSIVLALQLSGIYSQRFTVWGYLDRDEEKRSVEIKKLEKRSQEEDTTIVVIETPHRAGVTLESLIRNLKQDSSLCAAVDLTSVNQLVRTCSVAKWKEITLDLHKKQVIFIFKGKNT